jgi:hypothetical protein
MVPGLDSFREKFKNYTDYYTIIGGTACDILLSEADLPFRATKDSDDDTSSLSAILLNDDYYKFMMSGRRVVDGIGVLGAEHLIPFKMYAWINLFERKRAGEHVNEKDLKKHKYDVFRLLQIVTAGTKVESEGLVTESIHRYIEEISVLDELEVRLLQMGMPFDRDRGVELLKEIYL